MKKKTDFEFSQPVAAAIFLLISAAIFIVAANLSSKSHSIVQDDAAAEPGQHEAADQSTVPLEVLETAEQFRADEFAYIQDTYCSDEVYEYTESRLEKIALVYIFDEIEGETFEVYEADYLYRTPQESVWEPHPGCPSVYLVFSPDANGTCRWVCYFRDVSFSPDSDSSFMSALCESLMDADETLLWKLNAGTSLDATLEQTIFAKMSRVLPGDGSFSIWKQLALQHEEDGGTAYGLLLYYSASGSPFIYSEETKRYESAIFGVCWLPVAIFYEKDRTDRYTVTGYWTPSQENYEEDMRRVFPSNTAEDIFRNMNEYGTEILEPLTENDYARRLFSDGPVWPEYVFNEALDDSTLLGLVQYYGEYDIYTAPIRRELARQFSSDPDSIRNTLLQAQDEDLQSDIFQILAGMGIDD